MRGLAFLMVVLLGQVARADALPAPEQCPSGQTWVDSHSGGGCQLDAPTDCAAGWRGQVGGRCVVQVAYDDACPAGLQRRDVTLCVETFPDHGNGRVYYDPPREGRAIVGIVGPGATCEGDQRKSEPGKICLVAGAEPVAQVVARGAGRTDIDGPRQAVTPTVTPAGVTVAGAKKSSCSGAGVEGLVAWLAALALLARRAATANR